MNYQTGVSASALAVATPWSMVPPLGNLEAYISAANRLPMLTLEEEQTFSRQFRQDNNLHFLLRFATLPACRFDVVAIDGDQVQWLQGAFDGA